ncbi:methylated-DNA/protein-cysteine methyltransferase [Dehalogenimonas lykanthroporepellens BL-DC-9]|jgi:methylated-DNA-[protein]-cysteine S-methyltransferase|nr:methylated-DNA/protein-cysteine methyltransferase [Dehalogenimonas lykanthroporepellens BL-DC-9]
MKNRNPDSRFDVIETAAGWTGVEVTEKGVRRLTLPAENRQAAIEALGIEEKDITHEAGGAGLVDRLKHFFLGEPVVFREGLDLSEATDFQREVYSAACRIPHGQTASYGELAKVIGRPGAARAVGRALGANPVPVIIPCHRVVGADGSLTGFTGGLETKRKLLELEKKNRP